MADRTRAVVLADLFFASKVRAVAQAAGADIAFARDTAQCLTLVRERHPQLLILDLEWRGADPASLIREVRARPESAGLQIVGFASHMNARAIASARAAGADRVVARSAFTQMLPALLEQGRELRGEPASDADST